MVDYIFYKRSEMNIVIVTKMKKRIYYTFLYYRGLNIMKLIIEFTKKCVLDKKGEDSLKK